METMQTSPLTSESDVTVTNIEFNNPHYPGYISWTYSEGTDRYTSFDALPPYVEIRNPSTEWFDEAKHNVKYITRELLQNKHQVKLSGENNCANDMLLDGGGLVEPVNAGFGILVNFDHSFQVNGCILGHAPYSSKVIQVGQATTTIQLDPNQLYEIHGTAYAPPTVKIYQMSQFTVLSATNAQTCPYSIEPETFLVFKHGFFRYALHCSGNDPQLCADCLNNVQVASKRCSGKVTSDREDIACRNGRPGTCTIIADVLCNGYKTIIVDARKANQYARPSSRIPRLLSSTISALLKESRLSCFEFGDLVTLSRHTPYTVLLTLASMRDTYQLLDGSNLSLVGDCSNFSGTGTVIEPFALLFETVQNLLLISEEGLFSLTRGEFVSIHGNQVKSIVPASSGHLVQYSGYRLWS